MEELSVFYSSIIIEHKMLNNKKKVNYMTEKLESNAIFYNFVKDLLYLVDNGAHVSKPVIMYILQEGYDVFNYIETRLTYKTTFDLSDGKMRIECCKVLMNEHLGGRDKYYYSEQNGLLYLAEKCLQLTRDDLFDAYHDETQLGYSEFKGKLSDSQKYELYFHGKTRNDVSWF